MRTMIAFMRHVMAMPMPWPAWVALLFLTNMGAVAFLPRLEAWVVLGGLGLGAMLQMAIFTRLGFVRLLGLGHAHWLPMVVWLGTRFEVSDPAPLARWLLAVVVLCSLSLALDVLDVVRYLAGERMPTVTVTDTRSRAA